MKQVLIVCLYVIFSHSHLQCTLFGFQPVLTRSYGDIYGTFMACQCAGIVKIYFCFFLLLHLTIENVPRIINFVRLSFVTVHSKVCVENGKYIRKRNSTQFVFEVSL